MPSDDLAARLRALRRSGAAAKVAKPAHIATPQPVSASTAGSSKVKAIKRDDVDELIARTRDEVDVAREHGELSTQGERPSLAERSSSSTPLNLDVAAEGKAFHSMAQEASSDAAAALREHRQVIQEGTDRTSGHSSSSAQHGLVLQAKARPVLVRPTSSYQGEAGDGQEDDAIASELADAMGDIQGTVPAANEASATNAAPSPAPQLNAQPPVHKPPPSDKAAEPIASREAEVGAQQEHEDEIETEVQDLLARFTALRPSASRSASAASPSTSPMPQPAAQPADDADDDDGDGVQDRFAGLNLPSAPSTALQSPPPATEPPAPAHPTLGPSHSDIPSDRDLSPFHRLASKEFNVSSRLSNPTAPSDGPFFPSAPRSGLEEEEDEIFCSLCSEDASLTCSCPGDEYEGCAGDAYCSGCWVEAHSGMGREELREHRTKDVMGGRRRGRGGGKGGGGTRRRAMAA